MKQKHRTLLIVLAGIAAAFYIAGCVASATFSIPEWPEITRGLVATFWLLASGVLTGAVLGE